MADAQLVLSPLVRVTDANNRPIAGGQLRFYEAGTSTPLVVYADSELLVALGSTVNTDDGGYPISGGSSKTLIWTGPNEYKVVVRDADGVPLITHDNIRGALVVPEAAEASYPKTPVITRTTTTVISSDYENYRGRLINANPGGGSFIITLPSAVTVEDGFRIGVRHAGTSNTVTIRTIGTQNISTIGQAALKSFALTGLGNTVWLVSNGADWIVDTEVPALINNSYFIVADRLTSPPGSPVAGTRYIINGTPGGAWGTLSFAEDDIAESDGNGSWFRYVPRDGYLAYVADENLLTQWRDSEWVDLTNITAPNESNLQYAIFERRVGNGSNGGTATTGAWTNRTLDATTVNSITGASLAASAITLPVGKYLVLAMQAFFSRESFASSVGGQFVAQQRINAGTAVLGAGTGYLYGVAGTVGTTVSVGSATGDADTTYAPTDMFVLDVTTAGTINLQYYTTNSQANTALGIASTEPAGVFETYARVTVLSLTSLQGPQGIPGPQGNAATIAVGTVTTVAPTASAAVTNSGSSGAAVFDFDIPQGAPGQNGGSGSSGGAVLAYFEWNGATSGDPGSGGVLANNATLASATSVNISKTGPNSEDYSAFLASWAVSTAPLKGHLRINTAADLSEYIDADVTGFTDNSTYVTISLTNVTGAGTPTASDDMSVLFMRSGDLGSNSVPDYTALKALTTTQPVLVTDPNRGGVFPWKVGDFTAEVAADTAEGIYVASDADPTGAMGCRVRQFVGNRDGRWFGVVGDGVTDDTDALTAAFAVAPKGCVVEIAPDLVCVVDDDLIIPDFCTIQGPRPLLGAIVPANILNYGPRIELASTASISLGNNSGLHNLIIARQGLTFNITYADVVSTFLGTAIVLRDSSTDHQISGLFIAGFERAISSGASTNVSRFRIADLNIDCIHGIYINNNYDVGYINRVHCWPFVTVASTPESGDLHITRPGTSFSLQGVNDWAKLTDCFSFGFNRGFHIGDADSVTLMSCSADHAGAADSDGSIGFLIDGDSFECRMIGCQAAAKTNAFYINTTATYGEVTMVGCNAWEFDANGIVVQQGNLNATGTVLRRTTPAAGSGIAVLSTATGAMLANTMIEGTAVGISGDASVPVRDVNTTFTNVTTKRSGLYVATVASANTITLNGVDTFFTVSGTTSIFTINSAADYAGKLVTFQFADALTVVDGTTGSGLALNGNFVTAAGSTLQLVSNGSAWFEVSRTTV